MASVDKVKISDTTYDVSPSATGTLNGYTSGDSTSPSNWSSVDVISTSDTNSSIFNKITTMVQNVRWLYTKLGNDDFSDTGSDTITGALSTLQSGLDGKSPVSHTYTTMTLPVSSNQVNSENYVPTSALLYSMVQRANTVADNVATANEIINGGSGDPSDPSIDTTDPNTRYESKNLGTWSSLSDVDAFLSRYNHDSNYTGLSIGNYVTIKNGTRSSVWVIAGFDMEHNQTAADGTVYDNGYGICMIPKTKVSSGHWSTAGENSTYGGYKSSHMHTNRLPNDVVVPYLKDTLGGHIVNRNVLLSSATTNGTSSAYTWTTADATLMSIGQCTGTFASHNRKYDDGEANYKLPLFNYESCQVSGGGGNGSFWTRNIRDVATVWVIVSAETNGDDICGYMYTSDNSSCTFRPLIYIR